MQRRTRGSASLPAPAERLGPIISTVHTNVRHRPVSPDRLEAYATFRRPVGPAEAKKHPKPPLSTRILTLLRLAPGYSTVIGT